MKSAFELALERTGGTLKDLTTDMKEKISEIDRKFQAKIAEAELAAGNRLGKAQSDQDRNQIQEDFAVETASIRSKWEREKEQARRGE